MTPWHVPPAVPLTDARVIRWMVRQDWADVVITTLVTAERVEDADEVVGVGLAWNQGEERVRESDGGDWDYIGVITDVNVHGHGSNITVRRFPVDSR